jgi:hypothetical protein
MATDVTGKQVTAEIDIIGSVVRPQLAPGFVRAGFPSVNQADPSLIAFAGQNNLLSTDYNEDINFAWVTDTRTRVPQAAPLDRRAPRGPSFVPLFQARAGCGSRTASGSPSNRTAFATKSTGRPMPFSSRMPPAPRRRCRSLIVNTMRSIRSGFRQECLPARRCSSSRRNRRRTLPNGIATLDVSAFVTGR